MQFVRLASTIALGACTIIPTVLLSSYPAQAFCIYNETEETLAVDQRGDDNKTGRGYTAKLAPGQKGCVNWAEKSVNISGKRDAILAFRVKVDIGDPRYGGDVSIICNGEKDAFDRPVRAGGWLTVSNLRAEIGSNFAYAKCEAGYDPN